MGQKNSRTPPNPSQREINNLLASYNSGSLDLTESLARDLTKKYPYSSIGWKTLGVVSKLKGNLDEALLSMQKSVSLSPKDYEARNNLGNTLKELGLLTEAETSYREAIRLKPDNALLHSNLGNVLKDLGRKEEAEQSHRKAISLRSDLAVLHCNLGATLDGFGRHTEAEASYREAIRIEPTYAEAHSNLGNTLWALGRLTESESSHREAIRLNPIYAEAHSNLGVTLNALGRQQEAAESYRKAIDLKPSYPKAHSNLGVTLNDLRRFSEAETSHQEAIRLNPNYAEAHNYLGITLRELGRLTEAEASFREAIRLKHSLAEAHNNLALLVKEMGRLTEAEAIYRKAMQLAPDWPLVHNNLLFLLNYNPDLSAEKIFAEYQAYDASFGVPYRKFWQPCHNERDPNKRLRVGYVSPDFKKHSVLHFIEPILSLHDKRQVEVYAYAEVKCEDAETMRIKSLVDNWLNTVGMSDDELADRIRVDRIDILVDLAGHTAGNRLQVFARKPTPVSVSWLGYGYTTGLSAIDYYLTDAAAAPVGSEHLFSERPWRLECGGVYQPPEEVGEVSTLPALSRGFVTFGTLTRSIRINHRTIRVWSELLRTLPTSRLVVNSRDFREPAMQSELAGRFAEYGIGADRLEIGFNSPPWDVFRGIDIALDPFPHNSGTTLLEGLYLGVPFITLAGRPSVGRLGSSILTSAGHAEWIATTESEYVAKAVALAEDLQSLQKTRQNLRSELEQSPFMNAPQFVMNLEAAYREMWRHYCLESVVKS